MKVNDVCCHLEAEKKLLEHLKNELKEYGKENQNLFPKHSFKFLMLIKEMGERVEKIKAAIQLLK